MIKFLQDDGCRKHHDGDKDRGDRGREHRSLPVGRLEDRQRDKAGVGHRCRPALHRRAGEVARAEDASEREHESKANERAAAKAARKRQASSERAGSWAIVTMSKAGIAIL